MPFRVSFGDKAQFIFASTRTIIAIIAIFPQSRLNILKVHHSPLLQLARAPGISQCGGPNLWENLTYTQILDGFILYALHVSSHSVTMSVKLHSQVIRLPTSHAPPVLSPMVELFVSPSCSDIRLIFSSYPILSVLPQSFVELRCVVVHQMLLFRQFYAVDRVVFPIFISSCTYKWNSRPELTTTCNYLHPKMH